MITILCSGSRGDVQPYLALAVELKKLGNAVRIAVSKDYEQLVRDYGIDYFPIEVDFESLNVDQNMIREAQKADNPLKMFFSFQKMKKYGVHMVHHYYSACEGSDLIVYHPGITIGYFAAEKMGIPSVLASPFPLNKTKERPSVILYGKVRSIPITNVLSYSLLQNMLWMTSESSLKPFWKEKFGQLPAGFGSPLERHKDDRHPAVVSCSNFVFNRPADWNENIHQQGYWFVDEPDEYIPSKELVEFFEAGDKPIYIGFGSMFDAREADKVTEILTSGLAKIGKRAVVSGMGNLPGAAGSIFTVGSIPHSWLFQRVSAVCHHGGAGTTAAGFRAGVPSVILPFALDQFAWAQRAYELGAGSRPVPFKQLTLKRFVEAIEYALQDRIVRQAITLGENIANEHGALESARVIASCLEKTKNG